MPPPLQVLHLEDNPLDAELVHERLRAEGLLCEVVRVDNRADFISALEQHPFDLIVADNTMPGFDGLSALAVAREKTPDVPFIFVSGTLGEELAIESLKNGATDYVLKQRLARLGPVARRALQQAEERKRRQQAEQALRDSEERYRLLFEKNPLPMWVYNLETLRFLAVNNAAVTHYGYEQEEFLSMTIRDIRPLEEMPRLEVNLSAPRQPRERSGPWKHRKKDGAVIDVEIISHDIEFAGRPARLVLANDITERVRAEAELRESERQLQALVTSLDDIVFEFDEEGTYLNIWARDESLLARPKAALLGRRTVEVLGEENGRPFAEAIKRVLASGQTENLEYPLEVIGGRRWFMARLSPILSTASPGRTVSMLVRDITERKQAEQEIQRRMAELEAVNRISTALRSARTLDEMLPIILNETLAMHGMDSGAVWLYEPGVDELRVATARKWDAPRALKPDEGIAGHVFRTGQIYVVREVQTDARASEAHRRHVPAGWGGAGVPIRTAQKIIGVLFVAVELPREVAPDEVRLLTIVAEIAGNAIHRATLHEQTGKRLERLSALRAIDTAITSSLDLGFTLDVLLEQVHAHLGVDAADILLLNASTYTLAYAGGRGFRTKAIERSHLRLGEGHAGRAALERQLVALPNVREAESEFVRAGLLAGENFVSYYGAPLIAKGQVKGVLEVFHRTPLVPDQEWLDFLEALAGQAAIAIDNAELFEGLQRSNVELALAYDATIEGWSHALDLRDKETEGHTQRVTEMTLTLARRLGTSEAEMIHVRRGALLHDIGKMGIPDAILLKPGPLTDEEWIIMRQHPVYAHEMLSPIAYLRLALDIPYCHHEKWDGTGYPRGLRGEQIPLAARLFAVVDVWDALSSDRPYRPAWPEAQVREHIRALSGTHFDPQVVEVFMPVIAAGNAIR